MRPEGIVVARRPNSIKRWLRARLLEPTLRRLPLGPGVLDLCCGWGFYFSINPRAKGIDGDAAAVSALRRAGFDVLLADVLAGLPWPAETFDVVVAHDVFEHFVLADLDLLTVEAHRVLRTAGRLVIIVPNRKGYDYGIRIEVGHKLFVTSDEVRDLAAGRFSIEANYAEPLPRWLGRYFTHNKEVFVLRKI